MLSFAEQSAVVALGIGLIVASMFAGVIITALAKWWHGRQGK